MISQFSQLHKMFIRPTRQEYNQQDLGSIIQIFNQYKSKRIDIQIPNKQNLNLHCSLYYPLLTSQKNDELPLNKVNCVIYCHCNSGSRLEALCLLPFLISQGIALFTFDFSGSGMSEGDYVTLGQNESEDLDVVIEYLKTKGKINNLSLWGRSMGAVTCFLYLNKPGVMRFIKSVVFDSGFANLKFLAQDLAKQKTGMPRLLIDTALSFIGDQIKQKCNLDIKSVDLTKNIHNLHIPCFFICSKEDTFIKCEHTEQLYNRYNGKKWIDYVSGNHNADRNSEIIEKVCNWVRDLLEQKDESRKFQIGNDQVRKQQSFHIINNEINSSKEIKRSMTPIISYKIEEQKHQNVFSSKEQPQKKQIFPPLRSQESLKGVIIENEYNNSQKLNQKEKNASEKNNLYNSPSQTRVSTEENTNNKDKIYEKTFSFLSNQYEDSLDFYKNSQIRNICYNQQESPIQIQSQQVIVEQIQLNQVENNEFSMPVNTFNPTPSFTPKKTFTGGNKIKISHSLVVQNNEKSLRNVTEQQEELKRNNQKCSRSVTFDNQSFLKNLEKQNSDQIGVNFNQINPNLLQKNDLNYKKVHESCINVDFYAKNDDFIQNNEANLDLFKRKNEDINKFNDNTNKYNQILKLNEENYNYLHLNQDKPIYKMDKNLHNILKNAEQTKNSTKVNQNYQTTKFTEDKYNTYQENDQKCKKNLNIIEQNRQFILHIQNKYSILQQQCQELQLNQKQNQDKNRNLYSKNCQLLSQNSELASANGSSVNFYEGIDTETQQSSQNMYYQREFLSKNVSGNGNINSNNESFQNNSSICSSNNNIIQTNVEFQQNIFKEISPQLKFYQQFK